MRRRMLEIERKFRLPPHFNDTLLSGGAKFISKVELQDRYFDLPEHELTTQGYWLRRRNDQWELKVLARGHEHQLGMDSYMEFDKEEEILKELSRQPPLNENRDTADTFREKTVDEFLTARNCLEFACYTTCRSRYKLPGGVYVDLDQTSFGYDLGELELVLKDERDAPQAKKAIDEAATMLGKSLIQVSVSEWGKCKNLNFHTSRKVLPRSTPTLYLIFRRK